MAHYGPCTQAELNRSVLPRQANAVLQQRVHEAERIVRATVRHTQLTQAQFDAAVSFAYNSRTDNIRQALTPADSGNMAQVARHMMMNVYVFPRDQQGRVIGPRHLNPGLINRRRREAAPFLQGNP